MNALFENPPQPSIRVSTRDAIKGLIIECHGSPESIDLRYYSMPEISSSNSSNDIIDLIEEITA